MRVAGDEIDMLARRLRVVQPGVDQFAGAHSQVPVVHGVLGTGGVGQRLVHAGHDGVNAGAGLQVAVEHRAQPAQSARR